MLELNKKYKWQTIVKEYPDMWVFITDVKEKNGQIDTCKLLIVCSYSETDRYIKHFKERGISFECERTTFKAPNVGFLC